MRTLKGGVQALDSMCPGSRALGFCAVGVFCGCVGPHPVVWFSDAHERGKDSATTRVLLERASSDLDGSISQQDERFMCKLTPPSQRVYGEITFQGVRVFMEHCLVGGVVGRCRNRTTPHVFYDLGSGVGRMVLQVFLDYPEVRGSVGVELSRDRHAAALELRQRVLGDGVASCTRTLVDGNKHVCRYCDLRHGDILEADFSDATIIWLANSFMAESFLRTLCGKMATHAPHLQYVGVNDALSEWGLTIPGFYLERELRIPMSWDSEWTACIYKREDLAGT